MSLSSVKKANKTKKGNAECATCNAGHKIHGIFPENPPPLVTHTYLPPACNCLFPFPLKRKSSLARS